MSRSQVPRGTTRKENCPKCGRLYFNFVEGTKTRNICTICRPVKEVKK